MCIFLFTVYPSMFAALFCLFALWFVENHTHFLNSVACIYVHLNLYKSKSKSIIDLSSNMYPSIHLFIELSICLSISLSIVCLHIHLFVCCLPAYLPAFLSVCLSVFKSKYSLLMSITYYLFVQLSASCLAAIVGHYLAISVFG